MNTDGNELHLTAKIVSEYVSHHKLAASEIPNLIKTVSQAIEHLGQAAEQEEVRTPAVPIRRSVQRNHVICLDCGFRVVTLRRHIRLRHGLTPDEYWQRWGLKKYHPLTAPAYSERRSSVAKALGLGRKPSMEIAPAQVIAESPRQIAAELDAEPAPKRRVRTRSTKAADGETKAASSAVPTKKGRSRSRERAPSKPEQAA
ncbi:MAG: MucR family transcriptional regulator [Acidobacteria bacterium]|nr:MucR family transcriptional regulator [Acidobacteriota bacterium]